jgi:hypothetical protein
LLHLPGMKTSFPILWTKIKSGVVACFLDLSCQALYYG